MSSRRKHGQGSRYQRQRRAGQTQSRGGPHRLSDVVDELFPDLALVQLFRPECSVCGYRGLHWFPGADAVDVLGAELATDLLRQMPARYRQGAQCWRCPRCGASGAFDSSEWESF